MESFESQVATLRQQGYKNKAIAATLNSIQVNWLRLRKVLHCRPSETLVWRHQPVHLYRASELDVVRQCHEELPWR